MPDTASSRLTPKLLEGFWASPPVAPEDPVDRLGDEIAKLSAQIQAATYQLLVLIREFDDRGGWNSGFRSCAHWLNWRTGLDLGAAREKVRVARALQDLPQVSESMRLGQISYSKVRALTRIATPENESDLLGFSLAGTAAHVEKLVRAWRRVDRIEVMEKADLQLQHRSLNSFTDEDGMLVVRARLTPEVGAVFLKALEAAGEALFQESHSTGESEWVNSPAEQRRADALELVAESALNGGLDPGTAGDRYQVVVHVRGGVSAETSGGTDLDGCADGEVEGGFRVSAETSRRLRCDSSRVVMTHRPDGQILDVRRKTRTVHPALRRALRSRDGGCRFPGCTVQHCDAHHVEHWADGGTTDLDNLVLLCRFHHRALHEGGFRVKLDPDGKARFSTPGGVLVPEVPPPPTLREAASGGPLDDVVDSGLEIDEWTGFPSWEGGPLDLELAIDGLWTAISDHSVASGELNTGEIFIRPFPSPGPAIQVSAATGLGPFWSRDGKEVFFRGYGVDNYSSVKLREVNGELVPERPVELFELAISGFTHIRQSDVMPDGRFIVIPRPKTAIR